MVALIFSVNGLMVENRKWLITGLWLIWCISGHILSAFTRCIFLSQHISLIKIFSSSKATEINKGRLKLIYEPDISRKVWFKGRKISKLKMPGWLVFCTLLAREIPPVFDSCELVMEHLCWCSIDVAVRPTSKWPRLIPGLGFSTLVNAYTACP